MGTIVRMLICFVPLMVICILLGIKANRGIKRFGLLVLYLMSIAFSYLVSYIRGVRHLDFSNMTWSYTYKFAATSITIAGVLMCCLRSEVKKCGYDKRKYGLDLLRIISAVIVAFFHISIHFGYETGFRFLDNAFYTGAIFMDLFFILSGFSLMLVRVDKEPLLEDKAELFRYFKKRAIRIFPTYWLFLIVVIITKYSIPKEPLQYELLLPIEIVCAQAFFPKTFQMLGNGGTWFISVLVFLYLVFPVIEFVEKRILRKHYYVKIALCMLVVLMIGAARVVFGGDFSSYYANPVFRLPVFCIGIFLAFEVNNNQRKHKAAVMCISVLLVSLFTYGLVINALYDVSFMDINFFKTNYLSYSFFAIPIFCVMILAMYSYDTKNSCINAIFKIGGEFTFEFYIVQGISNTVVGRLINENPAVNAHNIAFLSFGINLLFAFLMMFAEKTTRITACGLAKCCHLLPSKGSNK